MDEDVEADDVRGAEGGGFGPADGGAGAGVNFFDGHAERLHEAKSIEHGKRADAIGDEIRGIFCGDDALAETAIAEFGERGENAGESSGTRYNLDQLQVARRVKEVRAGPVLLEFFGQALGDEMDRKAARVGGDDGAGLAELRDARKEFALDFEIFGDDFDDPIGFGDAREVIFEIADVDFFGERGREKRGGAGFFCGVDASADDLVAVCAWGVGPEVGRNDVEENAWEAGVGEMRGDASAHGASAEDGCFLDRTSHGGPF